MYIRENNCLFPAHILLEYRKTYFTEYVYVMQEYDLLAVLRIRTTGRQQ
jgi:hypothetical protein